MTSESQPYRTPANRRVEPEAALVLPDWFAADNDPWVIVDQMVGDSLYQTHYFCRACCADLTELRVHHVRCCPYCEIPLPFLLDGTERRHVKAHGQWPYDLLRLRFPSWCSWVGVPPDAQPTILENGNQRWEMPSCRLTEGHTGPHEYGHGCVRMPANPIKETA